MLKAFLKIYRSLPAFKGKLRIGKWFFKKHINKKTSENFTALHGIIYKIPNTLENIGVELLINGVYEREIVGFLKEHVRDDSVFFDIGANIGSLGIPVVKSKRGVSYYGFEASPIVFEYLSDNCKLNGLQNVNLFNKLVHKDNDQRMKFYQAELYGKSSLAPTYATESVFVDSISLDEFCLEHGIQKINWMKIDVQGFELYVFEGMGKLLREKRVENILFEFEPWAETEACLQPGGAKKFMEDAGYHLFNTRGEPWKDDNREGDTMIWAKPVV